MNAVTEARGRAHEALTRALDRHEAAVREDERRRLAAEHRWTAALALLLLVVTLAR